MGLGYDGSIRIDTKVNSKGFMSGITSMGNALKKLAGIVGIAFGTAAIINFGREGIKAASELSNAWMGLQSIVEGQGRSFSTAQSFINDYIKDGLVPLSDAVTAYKNLAARGYDDEQIKKVMLALKDAAAFGRQSSYTLGAAVASAAEGLKNENSILVDNAGVTKNVAKMWDDYAKSIGTTANNLTQQQKIQAEVNGILEETRFQTGDAAKLVDTYSGQVSMLSFNFQQLKVAVGNAIMPIVQAVLPGINKIITALTKLANVFAQVTALLFGKNTGLSQQADTQNQIASSGSAAAESTEDFSGAMDDAGDASKKAAKNMRGVLGRFDDLDVLASNTASSVEDAADTVGGIDTGGLDLSGAETGGELFGEVEVPQNVLDFINNLHDALGPTIDALTRLWDELKKLGDFTWDGIKGFYENFLKPVGEWVLSEDGLPRLFNLFADTIAEIDWDKLNNSFANLWIELSRMTTFVGDALIDFYEYFLKPIAVWTFNEAIPRLVDALTNGLAQVNWDAIRQGLIELWQALEPFAENVGEGLLWLWENILVPFGTWTLNEVVPLFLKILTGAIESLNDIIETFKPAFQWLWDNVLGPIAEWTGGVIVSVLSAIAENMDILTPILLGVAAAWGVLELAIIAVKTAQLLFNLAMAANPAGIIVTAIGVLIGILIALATHWDEVKAVALAVWESIKNAWNSAGEWINTNVVEPIAKFFSGLWDNISTWATDTWKNITDTFGKAAKWFKDTIITPVTNGFKDFFNGLIGFAEGFVNFFIRGINKIIDGINSISFEIPDMFGGGRVGFNIASVPELKLPRLANGAVIPPNHQFAAILGDQRSGYNVEAPVSMIQQAVTKGIIDAGISGGDLTITVPVYLDSREIYKGQKRVSWQKGKNLVGGLA